MKSRNTGKILLLYLINLLFTNIIVYIPNHSSSSNAIYFQLFLISIITVGFISFALMIYKKVSSQKICISLAILLGFIGVFIFSFFSSFYDMGLHFLNESMLINLMKFIFISLVGTILMSIFWLPWSLLNYFFIKNLFTKN